MVKSKIVFGVLGLVIAAGASAGITIDEGKLSRPETRVNPDDIFAVLEDSFTSNFTQEFTVGNGYVRENVKWFWMEVIMDTGNGAPQDPGATFDPAKWPTITGVTEGQTHTTTPRLASVFTDFDNNDWRWYYEVRIRPQPASETIRFADGWWETWGTHITTINVQTVCIPAPAGGSLLAFGLCVASRRRR